MPLKNPEKLKEYNKKYIIKNIDRIKKQRKEYYRKNAEKKKEYARKYYRKNTEKRKEWYRNKKLEIYKILGGPFCKKCGHSDICVLQIDHIHNDGFIERSINKDILHNFIQKNPELAKERYQILCANCHLKKTIQRKKPPKEHVIPLDIYA